MSDLGAHKGAARRLYEEVFDRGNFDAADEIMAPDVINHGPGAPALVGAGQIKAQGRALRRAFPDFKTTLRDQVAEGEMVCSRWTATGTHTGELVLPFGAVSATGKPIAFDEIRIDRFAEGRIVESWFIPDRFTLWSALGLMGAPSSA